MKKINILIFSLMFSFSAFGFRSIIFVEGYKLYVFAAGKKKFIVDGVTNVCGAYYLRGDKLYFIMTDYGRYIDTGVTRLFRGSYLKGNKLYSLYGSTSKFVADGVTNVFSRCSD
ncbi:MAG: hypothetical protein DRQ88_12290 [Epsilonproteobacteria bacterium]|nr:MAG: hypothetical protein DRQ88_12290 [Campylobacterota bacterium]RLA64784.1 MAG: hypothetical protein DRQ89_02910 [Campylobacterota bacterium]